MSISPKYTQAEFQAGMTLDDKVEVFIDAYKGWKIIPAKQMIEVGPDEWDFAILDVVVSYFEMIAKLRDGNTIPGNSEKYFKMGLEQVFPEINAWKPEHKDILLGWFWRKVRCGLYHTGGTGSDVGVSRIGERAFRLDSYYSKTDDGGEKFTCRLYINPAKLVAAIEKDFDKYAAEIRDRSNTILRGNFEKKFDFDRVISAAIDVSPNGLESAGGD